MALSTIFQERIHTTTNMARLAQEIDSIRRIVIAECNASIRDELCDRQRCIQDQIHWLEAQEYLH